MTADLALAIVHYLNQVFSFDEDQHRMRQRSRMDKELVHAQESMGEDNQLKTSPETDWEYYENGTTICLSRAPALQPILGFILEQASRSWGIDG
jgi:hypothetical protein